MNHPSEPQNHGCQFCEALIDDYVDGELDGGRIAKIEKHLSQCAACRSLLDQTRRLLEAAASLPRSLPPPADLLPEIHRQMAALAAPRRNLASWTWQALAAILLIGFGAFLARVFWLPVASHDSLERLEESLAFADSGPTSTFVSAEAQLVGAQQNLRRLIDLRRKDLSPKTLRVVERNLRIIDEATAELHRALELEPGNPQIEARLLAQHQMQISLLRRLTSPRELS